MSIQSSIRSLTLAAIAAIFSMGPLMSNAQTLYVQGAAGGNTVGAYDAATGATINSSLVSLAGSITQGVAVSGSTLYVVDYYNGAIGEYNAATGAVINSSFITASGGFEGLAVSGNDLYVANYGAGAIGEYNASTGAAIHASLITGLVDPDQLAVSGNNVYVMSYSTEDGQFNVGDYDATTGAAVNSSLITGAQPTSLAVSGNNLYLASASYGTVAEYDATTGAQTESSLINIAGPEGISLSGSDLYVMAGDTVGEYNATTGAAINPSLVTGLQNTTNFIAVSTVPEPGCWSLLAGALVLLCGLRCFRRGRWNGTPLLAALFSLAGLAGRANAQFSTPPSYTVTELGTLGGEQSYANAINNSGQIVGRACRSRNPRSHLRLLSEYWEC